jgi:3',5'-cyclic AMP phosphodiesterase CpdA
MVRPPDASEPIRLAHVSDIHVTAGRSGWRARDLLTKRVSGWVNLHLLGRHRRFRHTDAVLRALAGELRGLCPDRVIFSGDATALGLEAEFARAASLLGVRGPEALPGLAVPGNHDYYVGHAVRAGLFERHFEPWLEGERVDGARYPFAQRVGPAWLVAVNTSVANRLPWDSSGRAGAEQLGRLEALLDRLGPGPRILVTHYPVCKACGAGEPPSRALRDLDQVVDVASRGGVGLWLHGHRHGPYHHQATTLAPFPVICAGSTTQQGSLSYKQYELAGQRLRGTRRTFDPRRGVFETTHSFELELPAGK